MKKYLPIISVILFVSMFISCKKENGAYTIKAILRDSNVWTAETKLDTGGDTLSWMAMYVGDNNNSSVSYRAKRIYTATSYELSTDRITSSGHYYVFGVKNLGRTDLQLPTAGTDLTSLVFTVDTLRDVCLGVQTVDVTTANLNYNVTINVSHIMAKLALVINDVSSEIDTIKVILPNQANQFNLSGVLSGTTKADTISLTKAASANANGTYNWTCAETLIFPCANGTTSMPITVIAKQGSVETYTFNTYSTTCCTTGTRTSLSTTWRVLNYNLTGGLVESPWTTEVQTGTFTL